LILSATDEIHAVAYDAVVISVSSAITLVTASGGTNVHLNWKGGVPPLFVERANTTPGEAWSRVLTTGVQGTTMPRSRNAGFFRVKGN
jgi:hypothetical protein